jgi:menaquinone-dependent protoporphyrinogen oxidase
MPGTILVAYGTKHGSTREVAYAIAETLQEHGLEVDTHPAAEISDLSRYTCVVLGGAIYMGRWHPDAVRFVERHRAVLASMPLAIFGMGPRTMDEPNAAETRAQLVKALGRVPEIVPGAVAVFGGVIDPRTLRFPFNRLPQSDARDWAAIRGWAADVCETLDFGKPAFDPRDLRSELQQRPR